MKNKILTIISACMLLVPWTILPLRNYEWALGSPAAEIMIFCYAVFMICGGVFSLAVYKKGKVQNLIMKLAVMGHMLYMAAGAAALVMMAV